MNGACVDRDIEQQFESLRELVTIKRGSTKREFSAIASELIIDLVLGTQKDRTFTITGTIHTVGVGYNVESFLHWETIARMFQS